MDLTMQIRSLPRSIKFPIDAWHIISPPVQYLDTFRLSDLDMFDTNISVFDYVLSKGWMTLDDITSNENIVSSLKNIQILMPIHTVIDMKWMLKED